MYSLICTFVYCTQNYIAYVNVTYPCTRGCECKCGDVKFLHITLTTERIFKSRKK